MNDVVDLICIFEKVKAKQMVLLGEKNFKKNYVLVQVVIVYYGVVGSVFIDMPILVVIVLYGKIKELLNVNVRKVEVLINHFSLDIALNKVVELIMIIKKD